MNNLIIAIIIIYSGIMIYFFFRDMKLKKSLYELEEEHLQLLDSAMELNKNYEELVIKYKKLLGEKNEN